MKLNPLSLFSRNKSFHPHPLLPASLPLPSPLPSSLPSPTSKKPTFWYRKPNANLVERLCRGNRAQPLHEDLSSADILNRKFHQIWVGSHHLRYDLHQLVLCELAKDLQQLSPISSTQLESSLLSLWTRRGYATTPLSSTQPESSLLGLMRDLLSQKICKTPLSSTQQESFLLGVMAPKKDL